MVIVKGISLVFWLLVIPFCMGLLPVRWLSGNRRNAVVVFVAGYLVMLPLCWLVTVPCILFVKYYSFRTMVVWFTVLALFTAAAGVLLFLWDWKKDSGRRSGAASWAGRKEWAGLKPAADVKGMSVEGKIEWLLFFGLVVWQLYKAFTLASFDGDDAEYVAQSLVTQQSETMYLIKPYTGGTTSLDIRHSLAVLPVWTAYIAKMSGIHATILAHSILPFLLIPLTYMVYYEIGKHLTAKNREYLPVFMVIMALLQMFGNVSIYTNETFFLTRTWQGKSVAANFVVPATVWLLLWIFDTGDGQGAAGRERQAEKGSRAGMWLLLCLTNMTAGVCTSMVAFLNVVLIAAVAFWMALTERKLSILVKAGFACVPNLVYMVLYLFLHV